MGRHTIRCENVCWKCGHILFFACIFIFGAAAGFQFAAERWFAEHKIQKSVDAEELKKWLQSNDMQQRALQGEISQLKVLMMSEMRQRNSEPIKAEIHYPEVKSEKKEVQRKEVKTEQKTDSVTAPIIDIPGLQSPLPAVGEISMDRKVFDFLVKAGGSEQLQTDGKGDVRLIVFSWDKCGACKNIKELLLQKRELPFKIQINRVQLSENDAQNRVKDLGLSPDSDGAKKIVQGMIDSTYVLQTLLGQVRVPCYAWLMPDGSVKFGNLPKERVMQRIDALAQAVGQKGGGKNE